MNGEIQKIKISALPEAMTVSDSDCFLIVQNRKAKRVKPSLMKGKKGDQGLSAYLGVTATHIVWKLGIDGVWQSLISIASLIGPRGEKPIFKKVNGSLMMKYEGEPDSALVNIFDREELKLKFTDLTPAQVDQLKLHFSDLSPADIAALQKPATDAAKTVTDKMAQIVTETNAIKTDLTAFGTTAKADETKRVTAETARATAETERATKEAERIKQAAAVATAETARVNKETERNTTFVNKIKETDAAIVKTNTASAGADTAKKAADTATGLANTAATNADTAAGKADTAATAANTKAALANSAANRANTAAAAAEGVVAGIRPDWNETNAGSSNYIANKPDIPSWALKPEAPDSFPEAPKDNKTYGRKDGIWSEVNSAGNMDGGTAYSVYGGSLVMDGGNAND